MKFTLPIALIAASAGVVSAHDGLPINPAIGVPGYPDCHLPESLSASSLTVDEAAHALVCEQRLTSNANATTIACVGDSITAGVHSSGAAHTYPSQLQDLLGDEYAVTNLGACGSTMLKKGNSPYWQRPQYTTLKRNKWDIVIIMLGTNDAKDPGDGGPNNWVHDCGAFTFTFICGVGNSS